MQKHLLNHKYTMGRWQMSDVLIVAFRVLLGLTHSQNLLTNILKETTEKLEFLNGKKYKRSDMKIWGSRLSFSCCFAN